MRSGTSNRYLSGIAIAPFINGRVLSAPVPAPAGSKENAMIEIKSRAARTSFVSLLAGIVFCALCLGGTASAQRRAYGLIDAGANIHVRTTEDINASNSNGQVFHGVVDQDVVD